MNEPRLISPDGMAKLRAEWDHLYREVRPKLLEEIAAAAAQGDRSENAEYIYGKKKLREIDKRMRILDDKIQTCKVVQGGGGGGGSGDIRFGARVILGKPDGKDWEVQIVGADEIDPVQGRISMDSPIGKALMGRRIDDTVEVRTPKGLVVYRVKAVDYP